MKKKLLALGLSAAMVFSLAACGGGNDTPPSTEDPGTQQTAPAGGETVANKDKPPGLVQPSALQQLHRRAGYDRSELQR